MSKTILMTISRGVLARNILQTDVYKRLKESGHRLVILTPAYKDERFLREFSAPNVFFENLIEPSWTWLDKFLVGWHKALVYNTSTAMRDRYGIYNPKEGSFLKFIFKKIIFLPLSRLQFLKEFFRWLDAVLVRDKYYGKIFDKYKPNLVFSASVMEDGDVFVLKQAKKRGIKTVGAIKSWDNISKMSFRVKADNLLVWGDYSRHEAKRFQNYMDENIAICGVPQFDFYCGKNSRVLTREEFFKSLNINLDKRLIVFASCGKLTEKDGEVAQIIANFINQGLIKNAALFVRPHFAYLNDEKKFSSIDGAPDVFVDKDYERSSVFRDHWDYSKKQIERFTNIIAHSSIVIATGSTLSLDAAALDKPIINIVFDGRSAIAFSQSIARGYLSEHNRAVIETGGTWLVRSKEELLNAINCYLEDPATHGGERARLKEYFCYKIDGMTGERMASRTLNVLS